MASSVIKAEYIFEEYTYESRTIGAKETAVFTGTNGGKPPLNLNGKTLYCVFPYCDLDYITLGYDSVRRNISAYNGYSQSQNVTVKVIALYK